MNNQDSNDSRRDAGIGDLFGSMVGFATASTRFTFQQMQHAVTMFQDPQSVMNKVRDSMDNISNAMSSEAGSAKARASEPQSADDAVNGRKA